MLQPSLHSPGTGCYPVPLTGPLHGWGAFWWPEACQLLARVVSWGREGTVRLPPAMSICQSATGSSCRQSPAPKALTCWEA